MGIDSRRKNSDGSYQTVRKAENIDFTGE